ncbi:MAG: low specificity L-threonine aldolase [Chlorobiaceae bacterium]|nr:low specificity L-threonine aldolase [Chlorobiaceae bacterium]MBA4309333.1 low specificity L-threonine aldolase [Chlorobiaceae bacterium]
MGIINLRSDTVTKPSEEMRKAMYSAEVGDDVYREDPTVNELQEYAANLLGKEAALFVTSGVMGNQLCLKVLTQPADEVICEKSSHIFNYESGSPAALSGIQLFPIDGINGEMSDTDVIAAIRPTAAYYMPRTKVITIENTHNRASGAIQSIEQIEKLKKVADDHKLKFHLDGARIWNASVASGISVSKYASYFDTVSCCLSKGLGAPVGSIIASDKATIEHAFRIRKSWGGGMRQAGVLAAAGLYALKNNIDRLSEDHEKAKHLAEKINSIKNLKINLSSVKTNILLFEPLNISVEEAIKKSKEKGLLLSLGTATSLRALTHLDVSFEEILLAGNILEEIFG